MPWLDTWGTILVIRQPCQRGRRTQEASPPPRPKLRMATGDGMRTARAMWSCESRVAVQRNWSL